VEYAGFGNKNSKSVTNKIDIEQLIIDHEDPMTYRCKISVVLEWV